MHSKQSIYSSRCWIESTLRPATIVFADGVIIDMVEFKTAQALDVGDKIIMPGVIDAHVHINEPGRTDWEGFETATFAAAAGGITTMIDMPLNSTPVTTTPAAFTDKLSASLNKLHVNCGFYGGLVPDNCKEIGKLIDCNVSGIKCFLTHSGIDDFPNVTNKELSVAMPVIAKNNIPLLAHCELTDNDAGRIIDKGNYKQYLASRPDRWEINAVALMIELCRKHNCKTHIVHVSSSEVLTMIKNAKSEGLPLTAETCPHYLFFNADDIPDNDTLYKCAPPIRSKENNLFLKQALVDGTLDFLASDHSPAPIALKHVSTGDLINAWGGIAGLQFLLPASWSALKDTMVLEEFIPLLTSHPALFLSLDKRKGKLAVGYDADLTIWDPEETFVVDASSIRHRHKISPYIGKTLSGVVGQTIVNGELCFDKAEPASNKANGKILLHT